MTKTNTSEIYAELYFLWIVDKALGRIPSLAIATYILLIPGINARKTEVIAIEDPNTIKNENSDIALRSIAISKGVFEFIIISGSTIERVTQLITK